jgi:THUMP domain-containing protein
VVPTTPEALDALCSPDGQRLLATVSAADPSDLRLASRLRRDHPAGLVAAASTLVELRVAARAKFRLADRMWFTRAGLEQASSDRLAAHHAARLRGVGRLADLCTGIGGDLTALAADREVLAVDLDPVHARMAGLNAAVYGHRAVEIRQGDAADVALAGFAGVFVDPARRVHGRRLAPGAGLPPLSWCVGLAAEVPVVGIRTAPGLPRDLVPPGWEVEFVSEAGMLKEALLWSPALATAPRRATLLDPRVSLVPGPGAEVRRAAPGAYLLDPDPAVTRAGLVEEVARGLGAWKIDDRVAFLAADEPLATPFGRLYRVEEVLPFSLKSLRAHLRANGIGTVDIRKRGSAVDVDDLRRRLRLRGDKQATVILTRVADRPTALVCSAVPSLV